MSDELKAFELAMRVHHPDATVAEKSIAWRMWQSAWSEAQRSLVGPSRARVQAALVDAKCERCGSEECIGRDFPDRCAARLDLGSNFRGSSS